MSKPQFEQNIDHAESLARGILSRIEGRVPRVPLDMKSYSDIRTSWQADFESIEFPDVFVTVKFYRANGQYFVDLFKKVDRETYLRESLPTYEQPALFH